MHGICCSYDEVLRFKVSAAVAASNETQLTGIQSSDMGLVAIADNFDANITSPIAKVNSCFDPTDKACGMGYGQTCS